VKKINIVFLAVVVSLTIDMSANAGMDLIGSFNCFDTQGQNGPFFVTGTSGGFTPIISSPESVAINNIFAGLGAGGAPWMVQVPDNSPDVVSFVGSNAHGDPTAPADNFYLDISTIKMNNPQNPAYVDMGVYGYAGTGILHDGSGVYNNMLATFTYFTEGSEFSGFSLDTYAAAPEPLVAVPEPTNILYGFAAILTVLGGLASFVRKAKI
jgi:hypothetical protein